LRHLIQLSIEEDIGPKTCVLRIHFGEPHCDAVGETLARNRIMQRIIYVQYPESKHFSINIKSVTLSTLNNEEVGTGSWSANSNSHLYAVLATNLRLSIIESLTLLRRANGSSAKHDQLTRQLVSIDKGRRRPP
jgi:hypothetical protein